MSLTRLNHFQAKAGQVEALRAALESLLPQIRASEGCESAHLLQGTDDETCFVVVEAWASVEAHRASFRQATPEQVQAVMALLAEPPSGSYYRQTGS